MAAGAGGLAVVLAGIAAALAFDGGQMARTRADPTTVGVVGSATKVRPADAPGGAAAATLVAARNEFESFQVVVRAGSQPLRRVSVSLAAPLARAGRRLPRSAVTVYREAYYDARQPSDAEGAAGPWPDALIPATDPIYHERRRAFPVDVPAGQNRVAWVDVQVPRSAAPGVYTGALAVRGDGLDARVPIRLTVLRLRLPSTASLRSAFGMDFESCLAQSLGLGCSAAAESRTRALLARTALDDRISLSNPYRGRRSRDALALLAGRAPTRLRGARLTAVEVDKRAVGGWRRLAGAHGFAGRAFVYACDEPNQDPAAWADCRRVAQSARTAWPGVPVLVTASIQDAARAGATGPIDTLAVSINELDDKRGPYAGSQRAAYDGFLGEPGRRLWIYNSCSSFGCDDEPVDDPYATGWAGYAIDAPASEARAMGWLAFRYGAGGQLHWAVDHRFASAWDDQFAFGGNGDGTLFYPGTTGRIGGRHPIPVESLRLKLIRDGMEDYEYLRFLAGRGLRAQATMAAAGLFASTHDTDRSDADVQDARRRLAEAVAAVTGGPGA